MTPMESISFKAQLDAESLDGECRQGRVRHRRRQSPQPSAVALALAPMIDMSFTFLIFFVVTTRFVQSEGLFSSKMPRTSGVQAAPAVALPLTPIVVRLASSTTDLSSCSIRVDTFAAEGVDDFGRLAEIFVAILQNPGFDLETPVILAAEENVAWDHVVNAWNAALRAGYKNIAFAEP